MDIPTSSENKPVSTGISQSFSSSSSSSTTGPSTISPSSVSSPPLDTVATVRPVPSSSATDASSPPYTDDQFIQEWKQLSARLDKIDQYRQTYVQNVLRKRISSIQENHRHECMNTAQDTALYSTLMDELIYNKTNLDKVFTPGHPHESKDNNPATSSKPLLYTVEDYIRKANIALGEPIDDGILTIPTLTTERSDDNGETRLTSTSAPAIGPSIDPLPPVSRTPSHPRQRYIYLQNCIERIYILWGRLILWMLLLLTGIDSRTTNSRTNTVSSSSSSSSYPNRSSSSSSFIAQPPTEKEK